MRKNTKNLLAVTTISLVFTLGYTISKASENNPNSKQKITHHHQMMRNQNHKHHHQMINHDNHNQNNENLHDNHDHQTSNQTNDYQALLTPLNTLNPQERTSLEITIKDTENNLVKDFETFQEYPMHLIAVSDDLEIFKHVHPEYQGDGLFTVDLNFPKGGNYTLFSDFKPLGESEIVKILKLEVEGESFNRETINFDQQKTFNNTQINLSFSQNILEPNKDIILSFNLYNNDGQSIKDLQPYLGEKGHLVIIHQTNNLTSESYLHAHALESDSDNIVEFMTNFPESGQYKVWGQFQRNGEIITADFWVNVD